MATFRPRKHLVFWSFLLICAIGLTAQAQPAKKVLTLADYPQWKQITAAAVSPDAAWFACVLKPNGGDETLLIKNVASGRVTEIAGGTRPVFSRDSKWAACMIGPSKAEADKLRKDHKPVPRKAELIGLTDGARFDVDDAAALVFSNDSLCFAVKKAGSPAGPGRTASAGSGLIIRRLDNGSTQLVGDVGEFAFNKAGRFLAYTVASGDRKGNGLYLLEPATGKLEVLDSAELEYAGLSWDEKGTALAVLKGLKGQGLREKDNSLVTFTGIGAAASGRTAGPVRTEYDPARDAAFPKGFVISERRAMRFGPFGGGAAPLLAWSEDLSRVFCGIREQAKEPAASAEPAPNVDVWHWKDERIQSVQMSQADFDRNFAYRSVFLVRDGKFVRLADADMKDVEFERDGRWAVGRDAKPYLTDVESELSDFYALDTASGARKSIVSGVRRGLGMSADGRHFLYMKDKELFLYTFADGRTVNISARSGVCFSDEEDDHPDEKPAYGVAGWTSDGKAVIMNHRYDLWLLPFDGSAPRNLTAGVGSKEEIEFRYVRLDPEERAIDVSKPMLLSAYGEWTKKAGFYSLKPGSAPLRLIFDDKQFGRITKALKADKVFFTMESFIDYPDYYLSGTDLAKPVKLTEAAPQQSEYAWGGRVLMDFTNSKGKRLQAALTLPAGYEKGKRYPMLVYIYEKLSQQLNHYSMPTYDDRPHMSAYASDGYLVLMPDISYEIGRPGTSALDCVTSAVNRAIELGYADPKHIGLQGHSWGGFETSFILTQTDIFACVVSGAPPTSVAIEFNQVFKGGGENNHFYYERNQGRMGTTPWKDPALFDSQSAIRQAENIRTPFLLLAGTNDESVDWIESLEYYNAARRLGKQVIFLSYPGEPHHLAKEENQKDFQARMKQFFDHYLKGAAAPDWMIRGVPYLEKAFKEGSPEGESR